MNIDITKASSLTEILGVDIQSKGKSKLMKLIAILVKWFNPKFMSNYITCIGSTIYFPENINPSSPAGRIATLHELAHVVDERKMGTLKYVLKYAFPQFLALFSIFAVLAFINSWFLLFLLFLLFALPLPSPGRTAIELNGYAVSVQAWAQHLRTMGYTESYISSSVTAYIEDMLPEFTSASYYYMWPFKNNARSRLTSLVAQKFNPFKNA